MFSLSGFASVIMNKPSKFHLIEIPQKSGGLFSEIQYALRCHTNDPNLKLSRALECETSPSLERDFRRKLEQRGHLSSQPVKIIHGYTAATNFVGSKLDKICRNGFRSQDQIKFHVGDIRQMVREDIEVQPLVMFCGYCSLRLGGVGETRSQGRVHLSSGGGDFSKSGAIWGRGQRAKNGMC